MTVRVKPHPKFKEIYEVTLEDGAKRLATKNLTPGLNVYGERLIKLKGVEYRVWDAFRSKLAAAILKGIQNVPIAPGSKCFIWALLPEPHPAMFQTSSGKAAMFTA